MKKFLQDLIARKQNELADLKKRNAESDNLEEVRSIGSQIESVNEEIRSAQAQLDEIKKEEKGEVEKESEEARSAFNPNQALNVVATAKMNEKRSNNEEVDPLGTMEYRKAFKDYIQKGIEDKKVLKYEARANAVGTASDLGVLIPSTVVQKVITEAEKIYGSLYSKVKKTNLPGGVKYSIGSFSATFKRITETTVSDRQKSGNISGYVEFSYNIGEIRIARTLLQVVLSVDAFETEFAKVIAKAYVEAMDKEIIKGNSANNEFEGILTEAAKTNSRIPSAHIVEFNKDEISEWTAWEKKLFANIPLSLENAFTEFVMAKQTYVSNLCTMKDTTGQPIEKAGFDSSDKKHKFNEYNVNRVEKDIFKDFDSCEVGEYFGMLWLPEEAYCVNSNMEFTVMDYFDQETNQYVKKALVINDGKILDPKYIYLLKKSATSNNEEITG